MPLHYANSTLLSLSVCYKDTEIENEKDPKEGINIDFEEDFNRRISFDYKDTFIRLKYP